MTVDYGKL